MYGFWGTLTTDSCVTTNRLWSSRWSPLEASTIFQGLMLSPVTQCIVSKFADDVKLGGVWGNHRVVPENRAEEVMLLNKGKLWNLRMNNPEAAFGEEWPAVKGLCRNGLRSQGEQTINDTVQGISKEDQQHSRLPYNKCSQQVEMGDDSSLLGTGETNLECHVQF